MFGPSGKCKLRAEQDWGEPAVARALCATIGGWALQKSTVHAGNQALAVGSDGE